MSASANTLTSCSDMPFPCLGDAPWQREALHRLSALIQLDTRHPAPLAAAVRRHPAVIEYFGQAPVLMTACNVPPALDAMASGRRLAVVLAAADLSLPLRRLCAPAIAAPFSLRLARELSTLHPSALAQAIPHAVGQQVTFVLACRAIFDAKVPHLDGNRFRAWAVQRAAPLGREYTQAVLDFVTRGRGVIDWRWDAGEAQGAIDRWHRDLGRRTDRERFRSNHGVDFEHEVETPGFPAEVTVADYRFVALRSGATLQREGRMLHHCVATYAGDVIRGRSRIYAIRDLSGRPLATAEYRQAPNGWVVAQVCGPCNERPPDAVRAAVDFVLTQLVAKQARGELAS